MPAGSTAKGAMSEYDPKLNRHQLKGAFPKKHIGRPPADYVPKNRNERRAIAALQRARRGHDSIQGWRLNEEAGT